MTSTIETIMDNIKVKYQRVNVDEFSKHILLTDTDESTGLVNYCYSSDCKFGNGTSSKKENDIDDEFIKNCRGIVYDGQDLVMKAFSYTEDYNSDEIRNIDDLPNLSDCNVYDSYEGALIRMFNFKGKWFTTTHRKLNAFKSRWSSGESYGESFVKAIKYELEINDKFKTNFPDTNETILENFQDMLDVNKQYMFLVSNTRENRIVCNAPENPKVLHVGTFVDGILNQTDDIYMTRPTKLNFTGGYEELVTYIENKTDPMVSPGLIIFAPGNKQIKICSNAYKKLVELRGNQSSIKFRYLQIRLYVDKNEEFRKLYPEHVEDFNRYEDELHEVSKNIHTSYMNRFIHKQFVSVPVSEYQVIQKAHKWFNNDRENRRVTQRIIYEILNEQKETSLNQMLKRMRHDKNILQKSKLEYELTLNESFKTRE